ncbi:universal stress protein A, partial [Vibrio parahaemolyticus 861]
ASSDGSVSYPIGKLCGVRSIPNHSYFSRQW